MPPRRALITGIGGQDGSFLAELLLERGYEVAGLGRRPLEQYENLQAVAERLERVDADLLDPGSLERALRQTAPQEVYHLASVSFVPRSWEDPVPTAELAAVGVTTLLEAIRRVEPEIRFCQASSAEIFGLPERSPQDERTPVAPVTPYGTAKAYGHFLAGAYRRRYGLHASSAILFNHESPRRPLEFVTRKITHGAAAISLGLEHELALGDLEARRDWGWAPDYARALWLMLQQEEPDDYVIATGVDHSVGELVELAFARVGLDWRAHVRVEDSLRRGSEAPVLVGDPARAREQLGWEPAVSFDELVGLMVDADLALAREAPRV